MVVMSRNRRSSDGSIGERSCSSVLEGRDPESEVKLEVSDQDSSSSSSSLLQGWQSSRIEPHTWTFLLRSFSASDLLTPLAKKKMTCRGECVKFGRVYVTAMYLRSLEVVLVLTCTLSETVCVVDQRLLTTV